MQKEYYIQLKEKFGENGNFHIETVTEGYVFELRQTRRF